MPSLRAAVVCTALVATLLAAPAAHANFPASIETTVAPGGNATVSSPTLPPDMRSATVDVAPATPQDPFFDDMQVVLSTLPTPGKRLLACIGLYVNVAHGIDESVELQFPEKVHPLAVLLLSACLELAAQIDRARQAGTARASTAVAACARAGTQIGARFTRVGRGRWKATIDGTTGPLRARGRLKVGCTRRGAGMRLKLRPAASGRSLRSVVGPRLQIGVYNPLDAGGSGRLRLTFRR
ncbi:MAG TPA: hypothetical protein VFS37_04095 [Conexibacter sp.]|nr:hypothetical protein [Conexibacter sp.]